MRNFVWCCLCIFSLHAAAQKSTLPKFGKIEPEVFKTKVYAIDSSAPAVVLLDFGRTQIVGNNKGWFSMHHTHRKRTHILNKNGYDYATVSIPLYKDGSDETNLDNVKCVTYNWEGDKMVETKLEKKDIFYEQVDKNHRRAKFTFPAVKEGSVIEYEYTLVSDFYFTLMPWEFQGSIPRLWSEYQFSLPGFMDYLFFSQGYFPFHIKEQKDRSELFTVRDSRGIRSEGVSLTTNVTDYRWVMKDVPVLKEESFTSTIDNHIAKIEFQLAAYKHPLEFRSIMNDWPATVRSLMERDDFGKLINAANNWLDDHAKPALQDAKTDEEKARRLYAYVRDNYTCTDHHALLAEQTLRNVVKSAKGNVSEINLLLVALLRNAGLKSYPVILSTRDNGYTNPIYPLINRFNYVVAETFINGKPVLLDASHPFLGFGKMVYDCYNGTARVIDEEGKALELQSDSLLEKEYTSVLLNNVQGKWQGNIQHVPGYYGSYNLRSSLKKDGEEAYKKDLESKLGSAIAVSNMSVDSLKNPDVPVKLKYNIEMNLSDEDMLYINPLFGERYKENPFKAALRRYPVEMPFTIDETFTASIHVPEGYELEEMPKSIRMKMNEEGDAAFDYLTSFSNGIFSMRTQLKIARTFYDPEEYEMLREFFNHVVSKQSEQLVFKKKK